MRSVTVRLTFSTCLVVAALRGGRQYGLELARVCGLESGTVHPILHRLHANGLVVRERERGNAVELGRPLRTYYTLTEAGAELSDKALARLSGVTVAEVQRSHLRPPVTAALMDGDG